MSKEVTRSILEGDESTNEIRPNSGSNRRSFLKNTMVAGAAATAGAALLSKGVPAFAEEKRGSLSKGDAAILRFVAAAEIIESDIWLQYNELAGKQDGEVSKLASKLIPGYPSQPTGGNTAYSNAILQLDGDMDRYISDNTEDELSHEVFLNAYLASKGADTVNLDAFRTLASSGASGSNKTFGRLTNLTQLTIHTDFWTRYRSRRGNPDLGDKFRNAIPTLAVGKHTAIPRTDADTANANFKIGRAHV